MYTKGQIQKLFNISNMVAVRIPKGIAGQTMRVKINGVDVTATYLNNLNAGSAIALLTDKGNWYLTGEEVQTPNQSTKRIIESRRTTQPPKKPSNKVKILFYVEQESTIDFYIGGYIKTPSLVHSVDKAAIAINTIVGYVHNYGKTHDFTISYDDEPNNIPNENNPKRVYKCKIIQGSVTLTEDNTDGVNDPGYYLFNHYYDIGNTSAARSPKYKGNKIWLSEEIIPYVPGLTFGDYSVIYYPNAEVVNLQGTYDPVNEIYNATYENFNIALIDKNPIINTGITTQYGSPNLIVSVSDFTKTMFNYLVNSAETLIANMQVFADRTSRMICNGSKLLAVWKDSYIVQNFNFDYREYSDGSNEPPSGTPISLSASLEYTLKTNNGDVILNNNNVGALVTSITPVSITEDSLTLTLNLDYFTVDRFNINFIDTTDFINTSIIFAKKDNGFTWYAKGTVSSINVDGTATLTTNTSNVNNCQVNLNLTSVQKVEFISFASDNGSLLIVNGSINSLINSVSGFSRFTPENFNVINDYNLITDDCFINDFTNGQDFIRPYFQPNGFSYKYLLENRFDYSVINNLISRTTYKNKKIYVANVTDAVKTANSTAYIETWQIDEAGNFIRQDKIMKEPVFSLKNETANILSVSYYP